MFLSIDFEDFHHDLKRSLGLVKSVRLRTKELWGKYEKINNFLKKYGEGEGKFATFFCTGILGKKEPNLISQIASDGHEIACHYFFHEKFVLREEPNKFHNMLLKAKNA